MSTTLYLDPSSYTAGRRAEFRLPTDAILRSSFRLMNVGLASGGAADEYGPVCGAYGCIDSIQILDGGTVLDQIHDFSRYVAVKNLLHANSDELSSVNKLAKSSLGYAGIGPTDWLANGAIDAHPLISAGEEVTAADRDIPAVGATALVKERATSWLDLRSCFGFLSQSAIVPTSLYSHLRVVVNFKDNARLARDGIITDTTKAYTYSQPFLAYDRLEGDAADSLAREYKGVAFDQIETSVVHLSANAVDGTQSQEYTISTFNDKSVSKMMLSQEPLDTATYRTGNNNDGFANQCATAQSNWRIQCNINGANKFPEQLAGKMDRLAMTAESWGDQNIAFGNNYIGIKTAANALSASVQERTGQQDYTGWLVNDVVRDMRLSVSRQTYAAAGRAAQSQALNLHVAGVVRRAVVPDGPASYRVLYV